jgi:hypothetical protein
MAGFRAYDARPYAGVLFSAYQLLAIHYTGRQGVIAGDHRGLVGAVPASFPGEIQSDLRIFAKPV